MIKRTDIELRFRCDQSYVPAVLVEDIGQDQLDAQSHWKPFLEQYRGPQGDGEWIWAEKIQEVKASHRQVYLFAIEALGELQGLMIASSPEKSNLHPGKELLYVDYLASAPWNRSNFRAPHGLLAPQTLGHVGVALMLRAVTLSHELGLEGRVGLHSLHLAEPFYLRNCHFTSVGIRAIFYDDMYEFCELPEPSSDFFVLPQTAPGS